MSRALIVNNRGEVEVDPFNTKGVVDAWLASIKTPDGVKYAALTRNTPAHSEAISRYVLDLAAGKNTAKGHKKGPRSHAHLLKARDHLSMIFRVLAKLGKRVLGVGTVHEQRKPNGQIHKTLIKHGITMYDFRHNSVCHYLPIYKSENQMKYRYG